MLKLRTVTGGKVFVYTLLALALLSVAAYAVGYRHGKYLALRDNSVLHAK